jgi:hypothetical protein
MFRTALLGALACACATTAHADDTPSRCIDIAIPKDAVAERGGKWIALTRDQWQFMRGIYALNSATLAGLPYGDRAVLATAPGDPDAGTILFLDGDKACTPMPIPRALVEMMGDVAAGIRVHEALEPTN